MQGEAAEGVDHTVSIEADTKYTLRCTCGWEVITHDMFEVDGLKEHHLRDIRLRLGRQREREQGE